MNIFKRIIIKWFNLEPEVCESCNTLKHQLDVVNHEKKQMLDTIIGFTKPAIIEEEPIPRVVNPILPKAVTFKMKQQELERNDRMTADKLRQIKEENEKLEKSLGIDKEVENAS